MPNPLGTRSDLMAKPDTRKRHLSMARQQLIVMAQRLCFGTIHCLQLREGEPVLAPPPRVVRRKKTGGPNQPRPEADVPDFVLKHEWLDLFQDMDAIQNGSILSIQVAHGLPIVYEFEDQIPV